MTISDTSIRKLQVLLKEQNGMECDKQKAQAAGRAILRLAGIKIYQQFEKDNNHDKKY